MVKKLKLKRKTKAPVMQELPPSPPLPELESLPVNEPLPPQETTAFSEPSSTSSQPEPPPTHFDDLIGGAAGQGAGPAPPVMLQRDDFHKLFLTGFKVGHSISKLQSLKIEPEDAAARDCAHALYDTIIDVPALHFILQPQNKWLERVIVIGTFTIPLARSVKDELRERRAATAQPSEQT